MTRTKQPVDTTIPTLGRATIESPLALCGFVDDEPGLMLHISEELGAGTGAPPLYARFEEAGPRRSIYFDPPKTKVAIVSCGGLCPGINDVIRAIVMEAHHKYSVKAILGIPFGLQGFIAEYGHQPRELTPANVSDIHQFGGTVLGSSRGPQSAEAVVDALDRLNISILFIIGGDGTMKAAAAIEEEIGRRRLKIGVIGVPKTIDNDISFVSRSFGFDTAVQKATEAVQCAHNEAISAYNGIGVLKLMGRESGFIAAQAVLARKEANFVLVPEDSFELHGPGGFLETLTRRMESRHHAVVVVAEGAGQDLCKATDQTDASGNPILCDFSEMLLGEMKAHFHGRGMRTVIKFIDPSYIIRSVPANSNDQVFCGFLGRHAVHAGFAGKTGMVVSNLQERFVHLPFHLVTRQRKKINITSNYWRAVLETTGQPAVMRNPPRCEK